MKLWLDDERPAPDGWVQCRWPVDVTRLLFGAVVCGLVNGCPDGDCQHRVEIISLDHDLGDDSRGTGYDVLTWIETEAALIGYTPPEIRIHTANPAARARMEAAVKAIERRVEQRRNQ